MEVDTGAPASVISEATYQQLWPETPPVLHPSVIKLRTYTVEALKILGSTSVAVKCQGQLQNYHCSSLREQDPVY